MNYQTVIPDLKPREFKEFFLGGGGGGGGYSPTRFNHNYV